LGRYGNEPGLDGGVGVAEPEWVNGEPLSDEGGEGYVPNTGIESDPDDPLAHKESEPNQYEPKIIRLANVDGNNDSEKLRDIAARISEDEPRGAIEEMLAQGETRFMKPAPNSDAEGKKAYIWAEIKDAGTDDARLIWKVRLVEPPEEGKYSAPHEKQGNDYGYLSEDIETGEQVWTSLREVLSGEDLDAYEAAMADSKSAYRIRRPEQDSPEGAAYFEVNLETGEAKLVFEPGVNLEQDDSMEGDGGDEPVDSPGSEATNNSQTWIKVETALPANPQTLETSSTDSYSYSYAGQIESQDQAAAKSEAKTKTQPKPRPLTATEIYDLTHPAETQINYPINAASPLTMPVATPAATNEVTTNGLLVTRLAGPTEPYPVQPGSEIAEHQTPEPGQRAVTKPALAVSTPSGESRPPVLEPTTKRWPDPTPSKSESITLASQTADTAGEASTRKNSLPKTKPQLMEAAPLSKAILEKPQAASATAHSEATPSETTPTLEPAISPTPDKPPTGPHLELNEKPPALVAPAIESQAVTTPPTEVQSAAALDTNTTMAEWLTAPAANSEITAVAPAAVGSIKVRQEVAAPAQAGSLVAPTERITPLSVETRDDSAPEIAETAQVGEEEPIGQTATIEAPAKSVAKDSAGSMLEAAVTVQRLEETEGLAVKESNAVKAADSPAISIQLEAPAAELPTSKDEDEGSDEVQQEIAGSAPLNEETIGEAENEAVLQPLAAAVVALETNLIYAEPVEGNFLEPHVQAAAVAETAVAPAPEPAIAQQNATLHSGALVASPAEEPNLLDFDWQEQEVNKIFKTEPGDNYVSPLRIEKPETTVVPRNADTGNRQPAQEPVAARWSQTRAGEQPETTAAHNTSRQNINAQELGHGSNNWSSPPAADDNDDLDITFEAGATTRGASRRHNTSTTKAAA
jgi:hypothetical protein